jgi:acetyltransferase
MVARKRWLDTPPSTPITFTNVDAVAGAEALRTRDFNKLLTSYRIPIANSRLSKSADDAVRKAEEIGYPVVLKLSSPEIVHKSDIGGVKLNIADASAVRLEFEQIIGSARKVVPDKAIDGVLVQHMYTTGQEIIIGMRRDPQFGPLLLVGSGGTEVELFRDISMSIAPITRERAAQMLDETRAGMRLKGWRGNPRGDREAVLDVMLRLSQIASEFPALSGLEINPLLVFPEGQGVVALDVRGVAD